MNTIDASIIIMQLYITLDISLKLATVHKSYDKKKAKLSL